MEVFLLSFIPRCGGILNSPVLFPRGETLLAPLSSVNLPLPASTKVSTLETRFDVWTIFGEKPTCAQSEVILSKKVDAASGARMPTLTVFLRLR